MSENTISKRPFQEDKFDFSKILAKYKRFWLLFVVSFVVCFSLAALYLYVKKPVYSITTKVLISQDEDGSSMGASLIKSFGFGSGGAKVDDEIVVMGSQSIKVEMIRQLKLNRSYSSKTGFLKRLNYYNNSPIEINAPEALFDTLMSTLKFKIDVTDSGKNINIVVKKGRFKTLADVHSTSFPVVVNTPYGIYSIDTTKFFNSAKDLNLNAIVSGNTLKAEGFEDNLSVNLISKKSNGLSLYIEDTDIQRGKDILNKVVDLYNIRGQKEKDEMAVNTGKFIDERLNIIYNELAEAEVNIENYKKGRNFTDLSAEAGFLMSKKGSLEGSIMQIETEYAIIKMIRDYLNEPQNNYSLIPTTAAFSNESAAIEIYNGLVLERMKLGNNAKANNIALKTLTEQIDAMRKNLLLSIDKSLETTRIKLVELKNKNTESKSLLSNIPTQEREFIELRRQQSIKNGLYSFLLQKREENELVLAATTPKGKVVDRAFALSTPIKPKISMTFMVALLCSLLIPVIILNIRSLLTTKFSTQEELEELVDSPILGEVCHNKQNEVTVVKSGRTSSIVELFRLIRNNIQFMLPSKEDKVILITSSVSGEGKSFISVNIAASFALMGKKVVLVGMDIRSPKLAEYLSLKVKNGVTTYLSKEDVTLEGITVSSEIEGLDIIIAGPIPPNPSELLLSKRLNDLFIELKNKYDYIIVDSAPIAMVSDTFSVSKYANAIVYVTRANYTSRSNLKYLNNLVKRGQLNNVAVLLNDSNPKLSSGYGYGYGKNKDE